MSYSHKWLHAIQRHTCPRLQQEVSTLVDSHARSVHHLHLDSLHSSTPSLSTPRVTSRKEMPGLESMGAELVRSYIRAPPNRTVADCCFDLNCVRRPGVNRLVVADSSSHPQAGASCSSHRPDDRHVNPPSKSSFFGESAEEQSAKYRHSLPKTDSSCDRSFRRRSSCSLGSRSDDPPPYPERRSPATPFFLSSSTFRWTSKDKGKDGSRSQTGSSTNSPSANEKRKNWHRLLL